MAEVICDSEHCPCACHGASEDAWLGPGEASRQLGVGTRTLARWVKEGRLKCNYTPGGSRRYQATEIYRLRGQMELRNQIDTHVPHIY